MVVCGGSSGNGEKLMDSGYMLEVEPIGWHVVEKGMPEISV